MSGEHHDDEWKEVVPEPYEMPEGYAGNLNEEHQQKLYQMWKAYFDICDRASGKKEQGATGFNEEWGVDEKEAKSKMGAMGAIGNASKLVKGSGISKEDDAKAAAQARTEEANMEALLNTYGPEALRNTFWGLCKRDDPDIAVLRFLRARKWNIDHTTAMLASTFKWRLDTNLESLLENGDLGNGKQIPKYIENFDENGKVFTLGTNHRNQPVMYVKFGLHVIWAQPQATTKKFIIAHFELVRLLVVPPNDKIVLLFDCTGFGPSNLDVINFLYILQCLQSYFPETLAVLYLHKAPWILQQAWHLVKWLLDPVVRAKVQFTNKPEELMNEIPREHLLKYIGGDVDVNFNWVPPEEGENDLQDDKEERKRRWDNHRRLCDEYETVTRRWADTEGKEGNEERRVLQKRIRVSHFDYEPYWQGRWVHHRNGDLSTKNPGMIRWRYPMVDGSRVQEVLGHDSSRKALVRELQEIAVGAPVDFVEARTKTLVKEGKFGDWTTCEDLPAPPTGFKDGALVYDDDGGVARRIDVIGLNGPETYAQAANAKNNGSATTAQTNGIAAPVKANDQAPPQTSDNLPGTAPVEKPTTATSKAAVDPEKSAQTKEPEAPKPSGFFGSLKKKIAA